MQTRVKVDAWVWLILISPLPLTWLPFILEEASEGWVPLIIIVVFVLFLGLFKGLIHLSFYRLESDHLFIRFFLISQRIRYENIASIALKRNILSSMALSLNRIEIKEKDKGYFKGTTYISPVDREAFYRALQERINKAGKKPFDLDDV